MCNHDWFCRISVQIKDQLKVLLLHMGSAGQLFHRCLQPWRKWTPDPNWPPLTSGWVLLIPQPLDASADIFHAMRPFEATQLRTRHLASSLSKHSFVSSRVNSSLSSSARAAPIRHWCSISANYQIASNWAAVQAAAALSVYVTGLHPPAQQVAIALFLTILCFSHRC